MVELSIVILIIGVLIAAVGQGVELYEDAKLSAARQITQSSRVASLKNLVLWIDSTSDTSFDGQPSDGDPIQNWHDINPQTTSKADFTQSALDQQPTYETKAINGLPAIKFDGTSQNMYATNFSDIASELTVFAVIKTAPVLPAVSTYTAIISKRRADGVGGVNIELSQGSASKGFLLNTTSEINSWKISPERTYVVSATYSASSAKGLINGVGLLNATGATPEASKSPDYLFIGKPGLPIPTPPTTSTYFGGHIAEIIVFDRALSKKERQSVEAYLGKKWGVKMTVETAY